MWLQKFETQEIIELPRTSYECILQQVIAIAYFVSGEYYKVLLNERIELKDGALRFRNSAFENLHKYYGVSLIKRDDLKKISSAALVRMDTIKYPLCSNIESHAGNFHVFIVYDRDKEKYKIYDNFYGVKQYLLPIEDVHDGIISMYQIKIEDLKQKEVDQLEIARLLENDIYSVWEKLLERILVGDIAEDMIMNNIVSLFGYIHRNVDVLEKVIEQDAWIQVCCEKVKEISDEIRKKWYLLTKKKIRYGSLDFDEVVLQYTQILNLLLKEKNVRREMYRIFTNEKSIKKKLIFQLNEYMEKEVCLDESVYIKHDGVTVLKLLVWWEERNSLKELNPLDYYGKNSYLDFCIATYTQLLDCDNN